MKYFVEFVALALTLSSCSRQSAKELYEEGITAYDQKNYQLAVEKFREVVDRSAATAYAESSQFRIAMIYNNDLHDFPKSVAEYQKFTLLFPSSKESPTALFLTGFLFNNELHKLDSAKVVYEEFLQKYPDHQLALSAKFELNSLGKDPTELLQPEPAPAESKSHPHETSAKK